MLRRPGIEPGSTAWKAAMLTTIPPTRYMDWNPLLSNQNSGAKMILHNPQSID